MMLYDSTKTACIEAARVKTSVIWSIVSSYCNEMITHRGSYQGGEEQEKAAGEKKINGE